MATKTFKIGEYAKGGIIKVVATKDRVIIIGKEWDFTTGSTKSSNQSNAQEFTRLEVDPKEKTANHEVMEFLNDLTTSYYTDQVMNWVKTNTTFKNSLW